jgi:UPF0176 protein
MYQIATYYRFVQIDDLDTLRESLLERGRELDMCGTILLATEGINSTIAGQPSQLQRFLGELQEDERFADLFIRYSQSAQKPFQRYKVKRKKEIVTLGVDAIDPVNDVGTYVPPEDWNELIKRDDVVLIDTRNDYEVQIGTFEGAVNPRTRSFRTFPEYVERELDPQRHQKVAMFCTGGIRCEKATAYMRSRGFSEVYHLQGGILSYLENVDERNSLWKGDCFVFDDRIAVDHELAPESYALCDGCQRPLPINESGEMGECVFCGKD